MASEKDLELLDQYVSNRLADQDRTAFEQKLETDMSLKNEYAMQQKIIGNIREARIKELKTMFNNVPASALEPEGTSLVGKAALWVGVVGAIGAGVYLYVNSEDKKVEEQASVTQEERIAEKSPETIDLNAESTPQEESPAITKNEQDNTTTIVVPEADNESDEAKISDAPHGIKTDEEPSKPAPMDVFDPTEEAESAREDKSSSTKSDETTPLNKSSIVVETDSNNKKYTFHYQFKNDKLYLYGTFEKNLYEIMEFFSGSKRTVFLFYKDSYYLLSEENDTIKPLAPINDPTLLKKLKDYRGAR